MKPASSNALGALHSKVATALSEQVDGYKEEIFGPEGTVTGERTIRPSPALLGAAIAFLKNNNITADAEDNAELRKLGQALEARRKKKLPQAALDEAAEVYAASMGTLQ